MKHNETTAIAISFMSENDITDVKVEVSPELQGIASVSPSTFDEIIARQSYDLTINMVVPEGRLGEINGDIKILSLVKECTGVSKTKASVVSFSSNNIETNVSVYSDNNDNDVTVNVTNNIDNTNVNVISTTDTDEEGCCEEQYSIIPCPFQIKLLVRGPYDDDRMCLFEEGVGKTIVQFGEAIRSDKDEAKATAGPVYVQIPSGMYDITLMSYDDHGGHGGQNQLNEQWRIVLRNVYGGIIAETSAIRDLPELDDLIIETVAVKFQVPDGVFSVEALHDEYPTKTSANSIVPVCALFEESDECN